jgi:GNAT superfamily N-acetyltransferase
LPLIPPDTAADVKEHAMLNALQVSELTVPGPTSPSQATAAPPARPCVISCEVGPADRQALLDLFVRSSPDTRRSRFHQALSVFPQRYLDEILTGRQLALVARDACQEENQGKVFGLASAALVAPDTAEFAVWVDDSWQGHGVGTLLVRGILRLLAERGTHTAIGIMEPGNLAVRRLVKRVAPAAEARFEDGMIVASVPLPEWAGAQGAGA